MVKIKALYYRKVASIKRFYNMEINFFPKGHTKQDRRYSDPKARNGSKTKKIKIRRIPKIS